MIFRLRLTLLLGLALSLPAAADVIVLKSGRRIEAWNVEERGDRVYYETPDGSVSLPKSVVERIEGSDAMPDWNSASGSVPAPKLDLSTAALPALKDEDVLRVVVGGKVDETLLAQLEREATPSSSEAVRSRAAAAHVLIAGLLGDRNDFRGAAENLNRALQFLPGHPVILLNLAAVDLRQQNYGAALEHLRPVLEDTDYTFEAHRLQGYIFYQREEMDRALSAWRRALQARSDSSLQAMVDRVEQEARAVEAYRQRGSGRFLIRYEGGELENERLAASILAALESMFDDLAGRLNVDVREPIVVLLYPSQTFYTLTGMPPEVHGLFDGKIRVPLRGFNSLTPPLERTLRHELVHALVFLKCGNRVPTWVHEGLAQYLAGQSQSFPPPAFLPLFEPRDGSAVPRIEATFGGSVDQVFAAYAAALLVVQTLERRYSEGDVERFLAALGQGQSEGQALSTAFRLSPTDLDRLVYDAIR